MRIGHGYDVHKLVEGRDLILGGVKIDHHLGLLGHSDADVLLHAVSDALLGAAGLGDIGRHFPDTDPQYKGADSLKLLAIVGQKYGLTLMSFEPGRGPKIGSHVMKFSMDSGNADYNPFESFKKAALQDMAEDECAMMVLHPGYVDEYVLTTSYITTARALEVAFAINPEVPKWCEENGVKLITYADL
jgi:hypothetical protein